MKKKNITIDDLAVMVQKGFEETSKKEEVNRRFDDVGKRFDKIEKLILTDHLERIEKLEEQVKELRGLLAI
jgi:hypothetical protein